MNKHQLKRPSQEHPNPDHWYKLKTEKRQERKQQCGGVIECNACPSVESADNKFDLHHRHYDNFGNEALSDVTLLCRKCHDAISVRIWDERAEIEAAENDRKWQEECDRRKIEWMNSPEYKLEAEQKFKQLEVEKARRLAFEVTYKQKEKTKGFWLPKIFYLLIASLVFTFFFIPEAFVFILMFGCPIYLWLWMDW